MALKVKFFNNSVHKASGQGISRKNSGGGEQKIRPSFRAIAPRLFLRNNGGLRVALDSGHTHKDLGTTSKGHA